MESTTGKTRFEELKPDPIGYGIENRYAEENSGLIGSISDQGDYSSLGDH